MFRRARLISTVGLLLMGLGLTAFSCHDLLPGGNGQPPLQSLAGTAWVFHAFQEFDRLTPPLLGSEITVAFGANGQLSGNAGCNGFSGDYTADAGALFVSSLSVTERACLAPPGVMDQEITFLEALMSAQTYARQDNVLAIQYSGSAYGLVFIEQRPGALTGTSWALESFRELDMLILPVPGTQITLNFGDAQTLGGSAGCNLYNGGYALNGDRLTVGQLITTKIACAPAVGTQEGRYLSGLQAAQGYRLGNGRLYISYNDGNNELIFVQATL